MKPLTSFALLILFTLSLSSFAFSASEVKLMGGRGSHKGQQFPLEKAEIVIELAGPVVTTSWQLRFRNDSNFNAEGTLEVPLRPGCRVVGYAMDVSGRMRDGVVVEAKRARRAYDEIVSRKVDPGILETSSVGFSTKVYPLPAKGLKSVRIDLAEIRTDKSWQPPLPGNNQLPTDWTIICHDEKAPTLSGMKGVKATWKKENNTWVAKGKNSLRQLTQINIESNGAQQRWVATPEEKNIRVVGKIPIETTTAKRNKPARVELWWDGSVAGRERDREAVIASLKPLFKWIHEGDITLRIFRETAGKPIHYKITNGQCEKLLTKLLNEPAEGMVKFNSISTKATTETDDAMILVISEGETPLPNLKASFPDSSTWCLLDPSNNHGGSLGCQAYITGNEVRHLKNHDWKTSITPGNMSHLGREVTYQQHEDHWIITAEIQAETLKKLHGGIARSIVARPIWAAQTYQHMLLTNTSPQRSLEFAKREKVLSQQTAFIVLDGLGDYVNYGIKPPEKELHQAWATQSAALKKWESHTLASWTNGWNRWKIRFKQAPQEYGKCLSSTLGETSDFWAKHIGVGKRKIRPEEMTRLIKIQAEADGLLNGEPDIKRLKKLAQIQDKWETLREQVGNRIGIIHVAIGGHVKRRGKFDLPFDTTLQQALKEAGGADPFGAVNRIELYRKGKRKIYNLRKPETQNMKLIDNDVINVPQKNWWGDGGGKSGDTSPLESSNESNWLTGKIQTVTWSPERPYIKILKKILTAGGDWYPVYLAQAEVYGWRADYYLDVIELLEHQNIKKEARLIAGNIAQLDVHSLELMRRSARAIHRLGGIQTSGQMFTRLTHMDSTDPTAWLDLAHWHIAQGNLQQGIDSYLHITERPWDPQWHSAWSTAMIELNGLISRHGEKWVKGKIDPERLSPISSDIRVVLTWDSARGNVDLWVNEPLGRVRSRNSSFSASGGNIPHNVRSYGPEDYLIRHAIPGTYTFQAKFYGDRIRKDNSTTTVEADIILNFGRPNETRKRVSLRISETNLRDLGKIKWTVKE